MPHTPARTTPCRRSIVLRGRSTVQRWWSLSVVEGDPPGRTVRRPSCNKPPQEVACSYCCRWLVPAPPGADSLLGSLTCPRCRSSPTSTPLPSTGCVGGSATAWPPRAIGGRPGLGDAHTAVLFMPLVVVSVMRLGASHRNLEEEESCTGCISLCPA